ncbi:hypothetical protein Poli38472_000279 [Pythium oligandrum]|uniref:Menorin-like domain-containing protein n=1 Tax=Pythium oligandrum TaxID=41045 RepID=A0A8K1CDE3_PYTOL|nr:hypothetical protein Poli38472_000279 [Pythium oligandrum]|eukprot:TMW60237.1 hypothetical protein Poli38472_000279 [Pythium oligandrum]
MAPLDYRWGHAVNSRALLDDVKQQLKRASEQHFAANDYVNAIEADIIWSERQQLPVMGHPPQTDGELTLQVFLQEMETLSKLFVATTSTTPLIVKLDFKSAQAFQASYELLRGFIVFFPFPQSIFINADILVGPANTSDILFSATEFLELASALGSIDGPNDHKIVLSVGWTTSNATDEEIHRPYTSVMVDEMLQVLKPYQHLHVTFPLRATSVRQSWSVLEKLLTGPSTYGFTLWWAKTQMSTEELEWLYHKLGEETGVDGKIRFAGRTFYDILGFEDFLKRRPSA